MKQIQTAAFLIMVTLAGVVQAAPSETECNVTTAIDSPLATFVKLPIILANPTTVFAFAASSYRSSLCPKPELITREQAQAMIDRAVAEQVERLAKGQQPTVVAGQ